LTAGTGAWMRSNRVLAGTLLAVLALCGCTGDGEEPGEDGSGQTATSAESVATETVSRTTPPPLALGFVITETSVTLSEGCRAAPVRRLLSRMLQAFNTGDAAGFARGFTEDGFFQPYVGTFSEIGLHGLQGRSAIEEFAAVRYEAGDGWTGRRLEPPQGDVGVAREAIYGLRLELSTFGEATGMAGAKLVIECQSGLVATWVGPPEVP
jgi:hypothetical protein